MNAKRTNLGKVQEIYDVVVQTKLQLESVKMTREEFINPPNDAADLMSEGLLNRVLRVAEEAGRLDKEIAEKYGFDTVGARGVRNRLAHAYGEVDREIIWDVIEKDFDTLIASCQAFCDSEGIDLI